MREIWQPCWSMGRNKTTVHFGNVEHAIQVREFAIPAYTFFPFWVLVCSEPTFDNDTVPWPTLPAIAFYTAPSDISAKAKSRSHWNAWQQHISRPKATKLSSYTLAGRQTQSAGRSCMCSRPAHKHPSNLVSALFFAFSIMHNSMWPVQIVRDCVFFSVVYRSSHYKSHIQSKAEWDYSLPPHE